VVAPVKPLALPDPCTIVVRVQPWLLDGRRQTVLPEELVSHLATLSGERPKDLIRAEIVYFETTAGGAVFSTRSITFCGSVSGNDYDNNVSRMLENMLWRFAGDRH
jgi:hypothetical protein